MPPVAISRRRFLGGALSVGVLAAAGVGAELVFNTQAAVSRAPRFRSRPDLDPPPNTVLVAAQATSPGLIVLTAARTADFQNGPQLVDNDGGLIWFSPVTNGSTNLQVQQYQGKPVLTWWEGKLVLPVGYGAGEYVIVGSDYQEIARVQAADGLSGDLHEFVITERGTALFTAYTPVTRDLSGLGGSPRGTLVDSVVQEVDIATGKLLLQWNAADHLPLSESYGRPSSSASAGWDFFHINSIDVDADDNLIISARDMCALYKIDRQSGKLIWRLGGKNSDFAMGADTSFYYQHHARAHRAGTQISLFDDGAGLANVEKRSRGIILDVDQTAKAVRLAAEYLPDPSLLATSQGSMQILPDGGAFVGWGDEPYFSEFTADGAIRFNAKMGSTTNSYRAFRSEWTATPKEPPAISVVRAGSGGYATVYASWNGATEVARWDVLAGATANALTSLASVTRDGFETAVRVRTASPYFAVRAHSADGTAIGQSPAVTANSTAT